ncbi:MAG: MFS transporter [Deferribacterales bacterium]
MDIRALFFIIYTAVLTFSVLYSPQPLLPILMKAFSVDKSSAALVTTVTLFPLGIAPILYGYILEKYTAKKVLTFTLVVLTSLELVIYFIDSFFLLILIRLMQGFMIPGILTSLMTYISFTVNDALVQKVMSYYIAATILGGFLGRFFSGLISKVIGWRYSFLILGVSLAISLFLIKDLQDYKIQRKEKLSLKNTLSILKIPQYLSIYITIFCIFFVFASMLNFLPFRLKEISDTVSEFMIGLSYSGYIMGIIVSLTSIKLIKIFKSEKIVMFLGMLFYIFSLTIFYFRSIPMIFIAMFIFCAGMFTVHSVASGYLNRIAKSEKGVVNGLYVSFYYTGGTLGTFLPGYIYKNYGWSYFIVTLAIMIFLAMFSILTLKQHQ